MKELNGELRKKYALLLLSIVLLIVVVLASSIVSAADSVNITSQTTGVVEKLPGDAFTVTITFENTGNTLGDWSVNVVFESASWSWRGTPKDLALFPNTNATLVWTGFVPNSAVIDSIARLVVYYDGSFKALDWWVHIASDAQLNVKSSNVS